MLPNNGSGKMDGMKRANLEAEGWDFDVKENMRVKESKKKIKNCGGFQGKRAVKRDDGRSKKLKTGRMGAAECLPDVVERSLR